MPFQVEIKNVKVSGGQECTRFSLTLYVNGKRAALVSNEGTGGDTCFQWLDNTSKCVFYEQMKKFRSNDLFIYDNVGDQEYVDFLLEKWQNEKQFKNKTVYSIKGDRPDKVRVINKPFSEEMKTFLRQTYGDKLVVIINEKVAEMYERFNRFDSEELDEQDN